jgi:hypothetical protein
MSELYEVVLDDPRGSCCVAYIIGPDMIASSKSKI